MRVQLAPGKIHGDPADIVHLIHIDIAQFACTGMMWSESRVSLLDVFKKVEVQDGASFAELDSKCLSDEGVASPTLNGRWMSGLARNAFGLSVAFQLRQGSDF